MASALDIDKFLSTFTPRAVVSVDGGFGSSLPCVVCCFFKKSLLGVCWDPKEASGSWSDRLGGGQMMFNVDAKRDSCGRRKSRREDEGKQKFSRHDSHFGHTTFLALIGAATNCELLRVPPKRCPMSGYITIPIGFVSWPVRVCSCNHSTSQRNVMGYRW